MCRPPEDMSVSTTRMRSIPTGTGGWPPLGMILKFMRLGYTSMLPSTCARAGPSRAPGAWSDVAVTAQAQGGDPTSLLGTLMSASDRCPSERSELILK